MWGLPTAARNRRRHGLLLLFWVAAWWLTACGDDNLTCADPLGCLEIGRNEPIHLGALLPLSGEAAYLGADVLGGIELAVANQGGSILDHPLELLVHDTGCRVTAVTEQMDQLTAVSPPIVGIIGPVCSDETAVILPTAHQNSLLLISPTNSDPALTDPPSAAGSLWQAGYFRTAPSQTRQAHIAAQFAYNTLNARSAGVIFAETPDGQALNDAFVQEFRQLGGIVTLQSSVAAGQTETTELLIGATASSPDILYLPLYEPEGNLIVSAIARVSGLDETQLIGGEMLFTPTFAPGAGVNSVAGMYVIGPAATGPIHDALQAEWAARFPQPPATLYYSHAYDAANLLLTAVAQVAQQGRSGSLQIGRQALQDALSQTVDFPGATGLLTCTPYGDCAAATAVGVYQFVPATPGNELWPPTLVWLPEPQLREDPQ